MKIVIAYPQLLDNGTNRETIEDISDFQEKEYGFSFKFNDYYVFFPYTNILSFAVEGL